MAMPRVIVKVPGRPYPVLVGQGALQELPQVVRELGASAVAVVTDLRVGESWGQVVRDALGGLGIHTSLLAVEPGEQTKTLDGLAQVLGFLEEVGLDRQGVVVALGGGTVGDLAGFAAAVWLRGVRYVQVPTTLLAMVDSSVGGKTGVDTARVKNGIGAVWQPSAVVSDLATLTTLPEGDYLAAFGEIVKYAVAMDRELVGVLERSRAGLLARSPGALEPVIARCVELKAGVVAEDEREVGPRAILNYGHTIGHALESASGYRAVHGRAVAFGMRAEARIAARVGRCDPDLVRRQDELLGEFGLPGSLPSVPLSALLSAIPRDKKRRAGRVRWVLPEELGRARVGLEVADDVVAEVVRDLVP
jgi:3-dehydroquinate synthase